MNHPNRSIPHAMTRDIRVITLVALALQAPSARALDAQATPRRIAAPSPPAGSMYLHPERIPLEAGGLALAERGVIFVPVNRNKPESPVISLDVYRFTATNPQPGAPPIFLLFGGPNFGGLEPVWDIDLGDDFRKNFETQIPTVIAQGDYDVSTPLANAVELAPFFKKGRLIVVHGGSHPALDDAMDASPEFAQAILTFARTGDTAALPKEVQLPAIRWVVPSSPK